MPHTQHTQCTLLRLPCDPESSRMFKSQEQKNMFLRLHKQKCETCKNAVFVKTRASKIIKKLFDPVTDRDDGEAVLRAIMDNPIPR